MFLDTKLSLNIRIIDADIKILSHLIPDNAANDRSKNQSVYIIQLLLNLPKHIICGILANAWEASIKHAWQSVFSVFLTPVT